MPEIIVEPYTATTARKTIDIWNQVVEEGAAFPQTDCLDSRSGEAFFLSQSFTGVAREVGSGEVVGMYILHPNNVGRCGHICNASYAVESSHRGQGIGEKLVRHCMEQAKEMGYRILQFNAVVASNTSALRLYQKLGFTRLGTIPGGFRKDDGSFEDIIPHYIVL